MKRAIKICWIEIKHQTDYKAAIHYLPEFKPTHQTPAHWRNTTTLIFINPVFGYKKCFQLPFKSGY